MKVTLILALLAFALAYANAQGTCGGACTSSAACANASGDLLCRCSYLNCAVASDKCSGGCTLDSQCANWAGGDASCVCTWWFECDYEENVKSPGYKPFLKIAAMSKLKADQRKALEEQEKTIKANIGKTN